MNNKLKPRRVDQLLHDEQKQKRAIPDGANASYQSGACVAAKAIHGPISCSTKKGRAFSTAPASLILLLQSGRQGKIDVGGL